MTTTTKTKHIILYTTTLNRELTTNDICDDYTSTLGVYTNKNNNNNHDNVYGAVIMT